VWRSWFDPQLRLIGFIGFVLLNTVHFFQFNVTTLNEGLHFHRFRTQALGIWPTFGEG
jgi:hypothetical protein